MSYKIDFGISRRAIATGCADPSHMSKTMKLRLVTTVGGIGAAGRDLNMNKRTVHFGYRALCDLGVVGGFFCGAAS